MSLSRKQEQARAALKRLGARPEEYQGGDVTAVDESDWTCTVVLPDGLEIVGVQLKASVGAEKGCVLVPVVGSFVWMLPTGDDSRLVVSVEEVDKIVFIAGTEMTVEVPALVINGGDNGGVPISSKVAERLNKLEDALSDLITKFNSHTHVLTLSTGTGTAAITASPSTKILTSTTASQIENEKVKH